MVISITRNMAQIMPRYWYGSQEMLDYLGGKRLCYLMRDMDKKADSVIQ